MKSLCVTSQMKAIEQHFHVVLFIMLFKMVLPSKSVDEILMRDHSRSGMLVVSPRGINQGFWSYLKCSG